MVALNEQIKIIPVNKSNSIEPLNTKRIPKNKFWKLFVGGKKSLTLVLYSILVLPVILPSQAAANLYTVHGSVQATATPINTVNRNTDGYPQTSLSDYLALQGNANNVAISQYYADLATGGLGAQSYAVNGQDTNGNWLGSLAITEVDMFDTLYFTVPAGTYSQGVDVVANGWVNGSLSRIGTVGGTASSSFVAEFGAGSTYSFDEVINRINEETDWSISDNFTLSQTLVAPGTTLTSDEIFSRRIWISFGAQASLTASTLDAVASGSVYANSDFFNSARISSIQTPGGVTWTSASGVFLSAVPVPAAIWLFGSGLLGLIGVARRNKV
ncbi:MAG: hypothetical protein WBN96_15445 [Gammaproteobacteria bacterium]